MPQMKPTVIDTSLSRMPNDDDEKRKTKTAAEIC